MRVGVIGGGFGLNVQAPIIETHPDMQLVAVSTVKRHQLPKAWSHNDSSPVHYTDWTQMLDREQLDLVLISSLPAYHFPMVKYAIHKGIPVVCEKPFTMNSQQSSELLALSKKRNVKVLVDFEWRYLPIRQQAKKLITQQAIGTLSHLEYHVSSAGYQRLHTIPMGWMSDRQQFGGMLGALGTHMIDALRWLGSDEVKVVHGLTHTHVPEGGGEYRDADDAFFIHGSMQSGFSFSIQLLSGIHHASGSQLKVYGHLGSIQVINDKTLLFGKAQEPYHEVNLQPSMVVPSQLSDEARAYYPAFYPFMNKVYDYITNNVKDEDLPTIEDGHKNQIIIDKILTQTKKA